MMMKTSYSAHVGLLVTNLDTNQHCVKAGLEYPEGLCFYYMTQQAVPLSVIKYLPIPVQNLPLANFHLCPLVLWTECIIKYILYLLFRSLVYILKPQPNPFLFSFI